MPEDRFLQANGTLKNLLGFTGARELAVAETDYAAQGLAEIQSGQAPVDTRGRFDLAHLKAIHRHLFQDVYEWAGTTRAEPTTLEGETFRQRPLLMKGTTTFEPSNRVNRKLDAAFVQLKDSGYLHGLSRHDFTLQAADLFVQINTAHAFREGNGRTQREFITQLADQAGHPLSFEVVSRERMTVASYDGVQGDPGTMRRLFDEISDPDRVAVLARAVQYLEGAHGVEWHELYVASTTQERGYAGQLVTTKPGFFVLSSGGDVIVGHPQDLPDGHGSRVSLQASAFPGYDESTHPRLERGLEF